MPSQSRKSKAGETGLQGLGISLVGIGVGMVEVKPKLGVAVLFAGIAAIYASVTIRNMSVSVKPSEVVKGIDKSLDEVSDMMKDDSK